jgi:hypothetical protein
MLDRIGVTLFGAFFVLAGLGVAAGIALIALVLRAVALVLNLVPVRR